MWSDLNRPGCQFECKVVVCWRVYSKSGCGSAHDGPSGRAVRKPWKSGIGGSGDGGGFFFLPASAVQTRVNVSFRPVLLCAVAVTINTWWREKPVERWKWKEESEEWKRRSQMAHVDRATDQSGRADVQWTAEWSAIEPAASLDAVQVTPGGIAEWNQVVRCKALVSVCYEGAKQSHLRWRPAEICLADNWPVRRRKCASASDQVSGAGRRPVLSICVADPPTLTCLWSIYQSNWAELMPIYGLLGVKGALRSPQTAPVAAQLFHFIRTELLASSCLCNAQKFWINKTLRNGRRKRAEDSGPENSSVEFDWKLVERVKLMFQGHRVGLLTPVRWAIRSIPHFRTSALKG